MLSSAVLVLALTVAAGQGEGPAPNYENLKCYEALIGTWCYDGPLLEETPEAKKGSPFVARMSFAWILNKGAIEVTWKVKYEAGIETTGKSLHGWDPKERRLVIGGMDSLGALHLGTVAYDSATKTWTLDLKGVSPSGDDTSTTITNTLPNPDTLVWQAKERRGSVPAGQSPQYHFKRQKLQTQAPQ